LPPAKISCRFSSETEVSRRERIRERLRGCGGNRSINLCRAAAATSTAAAKLEKIQFPLFPSGLYLVERNLHKHETQIACGKHASEGPSATEGLAHLQGIPRQRRVQRQQLCHEIFAGHLHPGENHEPHEGHGHLKTRDCELQGRNGTWTGTGEKCQS